MATPGIGWCGLSAFLPCENRLACLPWVNFIEKSEQLPILREQRNNLIELRMLGDEMLPADRRDETETAGAALDHRIAAIAQRRGSEQPLQPAPIVL